MEWLWVLALAVPILGPIAWVILKGRRAGHPKHEGSLEAAGTIQVMKDTMDMNNTFSPR